MSTPIASWGDDELKLTDRVSVLVGAENGKYPSGNSIVVRGRAETMLIDPSVCVVDRGGAPVSVDVVVNSHAHEDHVAGNGTFANARVMAHHDDLVGVQSLDGLLDVFGYEEDELRQENAIKFVEEYHYAPRPDATGFGDGHRFDLGEIAVEAMHLPGHTRGHSGFYIDGGVFFLSDIDLTGFGPYYGDAWSSLEQFDDSLQKAREVEADWYVTFHHKGVIEGRAAYIEMIDGFHAVIDKRHSEMLEFLAEPRTLAEMARRRFVYRPTVELSFATKVELRTAELHVARMLERGEATDVEPGLFKAV